MLSSRALALTAALLLVPAGISALEKPKVRVQFSLAEPVYLDRYSTQEITSIESMVTSFLIGKLSSEIGFLAFTKTPADFTVIFRLGDPKSSKRLFHDVRFQVLLTGPAGASRTAYLPFRGPDTWADSTGYWMQLETEVQSQLSKISSRDLVSEVWSMISVASEGQLVHKPPDFESAWILPFRPVDLCIDFSSEVKLATEVSTELGPMYRNFLAEAIMAYNPAGVQEKMRNRLLCAPKTGQSGLDVVRRSAPSAVKVKEIFVMRYIQMSGCQGPLPPTAVTASFGARK